MKLLKQANHNIPRSREERDNMIEEASHYYAGFLEALGFDYMADPQTEKTPYRVAKAWVNDLIEGSLTPPPSMTTFPNEEQYNGVVIQSGIPVVSMCAHHNLPFMGYATIGYVPDENVLGLSKLNRIVDWFARRPQMQESLTQQIFAFLKEKLQCENVAVSISSRHTCCGNRGIKHPTSVMTTNKFGGVFLEKDNLIREELFQAINKNGQDL